ncbi:HXXEE domain-containing protein [Georgenia sp. Z1344]|uniref:HXXEE domain-containing protein n=1 Tax=Georgenia sp. Z1344 TaxID=3416706 RepID=UPI003CEE39C8
MELMVTTPARTDKPPGAGHRRQSQLWGATALAVVLHNTEECLLDMTGWIAEHPWLPGRSLHGDPAEFALVLALVTLAVLGLAAVAVGTRPRWSATVLACVACALMVNGAGHVVLSLLSWSPMPGLVSGVALLLPLGTLVSRELPPVRWTSSTVTLATLAAVGLTAGAFALAAVLTALVGRVA